MAQYCEYFYHFNVKFSIVEQLKCSHATNYKQDIIILSGAVEIKLQLSVNVAGVYFVYNV